MANKAASKKSVSTKKVPVKPAGKVGPSANRVKPAKESMAAKVANVESSASTPQPTRPLDMRSLETRVAELADRSETLAARVAALELALRKVLEYWPQGRGKLRKALHTRSKRVARTIDKSVPVVDRPSWQKAIDELIAAIG